MKHYRINCTSLTGVNGKPLEKDKTYPETDFMHLDQHEKNNHAILVNETVEPALIPETTEAIVSDPVTEEVVAGDVNETVEPGKKKKK